MQKKIRTEYRIDYDDPYCTDGYVSSPDKVAVESLTGVTAQHVMEKAVTDFGSAYRFTATYYGAALGYSIDKLNGVSNDNASDCVWRLFTRRRDGKTILSPVGISNFYILEDGLTIVMSYGQTLQ